MVPGQVTAPAALVAVTVVWGFTFVPVKDAVELYPVLPFNAVRFAIAAAALALVAGRRLVRLGRGGLARGLALGLLLASGYELQTAGLDLTTVSSTGFVTGMYVVLTPLIGLVLFRSRIGLQAWAGVALATAGLALLSGIQAGSTAGDLLVLAGAAVYSLQIVLMERYAPRYDPLAFTLAEMLAAAGGFAVVALAVGQLGTPRGGTVWFALVVTGVFASALAYLVQTWAQRRTSAARTALAFTMEPVFAALFGYALADDRLGLAGWLGGALIVTGILAAEPAAAALLARLVRRPRPV